MFLKNVASQKVGAQLISASDGSAFTGSVTVAVTVDAGTQAAGSVGSGACTHEGGGYHTYAPAQAETNGELVAFSFSGTGAVPVTVQIYPLPATGVLAPATLGRTLVVDAAGLADANMVKAGPSGSGTAQTARDIGASVLLSSGTGTGQVKLASGYVAPNWGDVGNPTTSLALSGTTIATTQKVDVETIKTQSVTCSGGVTVPAATLASTTNITAAAGCTVSSIGSGVITASAIAADAIGASELAADAVAKIADAIWDEVQSGHTTAGTFGKYLDAAVSGVSTGGVSAADIADAVWDEVCSGHVTNGTYGKAFSGATSVFLASGIAGTINTLDALDTAQDSQHSTTQSAIAALNNLSAAQVNAECDTALSDAGVTVARMGALTDWIDGGRLDLLLDATLADTNELQTDWVNGGRLDLLIDGIKAKTDNLPAAPAATEDIPTAAQNAAGLLDLAAGIETGLTLRQAMRLVAAAAAGKISGAATTTIVIRNAVADSKDRITATVDADGNRSAITVDLT